MNYSVDLGTVKDRIGSGHEYLIEWANQENKQTCSIQHLVSLIQHRKKTRKVRNFGYESFLVCSC